MRRAKIRPSINLSASRRSVAATPASKPKETTVPKQESAAESKPGLRSASNPPASQLAEPQPQASQEKQVHEEQSQQDVQSKQQQQQQQQQQHDQDTEKQDQKTDAGQAAAAERQQDPALPPDQPTPEPPSTKPTLVSPPKPVPSSPSKAAPDSPTKSANVRRKRITAVPNLGQQRLRPSPNLPTKPRPKLTLGKEKETATRGAGVVQEATEGQMGPPQQPPPVQRIISSTAPTTPVSIKEPAKVASKPQDSQTKPQVPPISQINHAPTAVTTPSRPFLSRTDSMAEKHPVGSENIYEKKLRELKDRIDSETPSRRRRHYVKKKVQPPERSKMTMSDLIYFNPKTSPMKNTVGSKEKKFPRTIMTEHVVSANNSVNNSAHNSENEDDDEDEKEEDVDPFAPQVKIGPDGSIVLDSSSLVKDASPAKTLHLTDNDIIQEESSHTTYASFRKRTHTTAWSEKDTAKFYRALSAVGTDFTMINAMFPNRTRRQIKNKFKREERVNRQRLDKAIRDRQHFDISLFNKEASSDSETENHVDQRTKGKKGRPKAQGQKRGRGKAKGKTKNKMADGDIDRDSDEESVNTEVGSKGEAPDIAKDAALEEEDPKQDVATRQSDGSDEEVSVEAILSQPTRSGRQPKFKTSFTVEEPQRRKRGPYRKNPEKGLIASLGIKKANTLAQKLPTKDSFPPYTPGGLSWSPLSHPAQASTTRVRPASGSPLVRSVGGSRGMTSPGNRGISTITTPMGRFVVSVPQQPANHQGGAPLRPTGTPSPQAASPSEGSRKAMRSHIFVISSPDGTQNIIQVPVQPDPSSAEADQQQSSGQTLNRPSGTSLPRPQNPMTTPRILRTATKNLPRSPMVIVHQVPAQSPQQHVTSSSTDPTQSHSESSQQVQTSQVSGSHISMPVHRQRATDAKSNQCQQIPRPLKREHPKPLAFFPSSGSNKVIIMSPHAQPQVLGWTNPHVSQPNSTAVSPAMQAETTSPTVIAHNQNSNETPLQQVHQELVSSPVPGQHGETCVSHHSEFTPADTPATSVTTYDPAQKVSHMTSDTNTDWLLRDEAVVHEVDIPTTDFIEEVAETDEPFIPPSNLGHSPLQMNESDQVIMSHVTEEHLTAQDILEQMTYEQGVEGDVGANMEVAINEEIITQIATEMTVE